MSAYFAGKLSSGIGSNARRLADLQKQFQTVVRRLRAIELTVGRLKSTLLPNVRKTRH